MKRLALGLAIVAAATVTWADFELTLIHVNDQHARVEPVRVGQENFGGYARQASLIASLRERYPNHLVLNAGDVFAGTLFFTVYQGLADLAFMNSIGYDAMTVGNHEFDKGPGALAEFGKRASFPLLAANLDVSAEPLLKELIKPSAVFEVEGEKIGVVGAITEDTPSISSPGENVKFLPVAASVQAEVDRLSAQGIDKIVLLSHVGFSEDLQLARELKGVDVIIGGHSHTPLGTSALLGFPQTDNAYPTVVGDADRPVLVVQAWQYGTLVGRLSVSFDDRGQVSSWNGAPIPVSSEWEVSPEHAALLAALSKPIDQLKSSVVGEAAVAIERGERGGPSPMANLVADAQLEATRKAGAQIAFVNAGGVRDRIDAGPITFEEAIMVQPFGNTLVLVDLTGAELKAVLDQGVDGGFLHASAGFQWWIDRHKPSGERVVRMSLDGQDVTPDQKLRVSFNSFTANGGDAHTVLKGLTGYRVDTGLTDIDAFVEFLKARTPVRPDVDPRAVFVGQ